MLRHDGSDRHRHNFEASGVAVALMRGLLEERRSRSGVEPGGLASAASLSVGKGVVEGGKRVGRVGVELE